MRRNKPTLIALIVVCVLTASAIFAKDQQPMTADDAVRLMKEGNKRFVTMRLEHPNLSAARREAVAVEAQQPFATVLGCSRKSGDVSKRDTKVSDVSQSDMSRDTRDTKNLGTKSNEKSDARRIHSDKRRQGLV